MPHHRPRTRSARHRRREATGHHYCRQAFFLNSRRACDHIQIQAHSCRHKLCLSLHLTILRLQLLDQSLTPTVILSFLQC